MKKSVVTVLASVFVLSSVLVGCSKEDPKASSAPSGSPAASGKQITMKLRHTQIKENAAKTKARIEKAAKETEGKVPGLSIELEGVDEVVNRDTKMKAEFASGQPPEIFELFGGTDTKNYAKTGKLLDLTPIIEELGLKDKFYNLSEFTVDGKVYGLPRAGFVEGVFYNKKIFADNGLEVPKTWKEFEDLCQKLKDKGITPFALGAAEGWVINMMPNTLWVRTAGIDIVENIAAGKAKWNDPDVVKGFKIFEDMLKKEYFTKNAIGLKYDAMQASFAQGQAAMSFDGGWAQSTYANKEKSKIVDDLGFFVLPNIEDGKGNDSVNASYSNGFGFRAGMDENQMKAVKEFIKVLYSDAYQKEALLEEGHLPSMKLTDTSGMPKIVSEMLSVTEGKKTFPAFDALIPAKVKTDLEDRMQKLVSGKITVEKLTEEIQKVQEQESKK